MSRRIRFQLEPDDAPELDVASLVDIAFLLLIYFLITSTLQKRETDLGMILPADTPTNTPFKIDPMTIKIRKDGEVLINKELVEPAGDKRPLPKLRERLTDYKQVADHSDQKPVVIVDAEDDSKQQRFVDVIDTLAAVKIKNVTITGFRQR